MAKIDAGMLPLLDTFVFETDGLLESLDEILMRTEKSGISGDDVNEIFRIMHTVKGSAAMMGLSNMSALAHAVEDLFSVIREDPSVSYDKAELYELLFESCDCLKNETETLADEAAELTDFSKLAAVIRSFAEKLKHTENASDGGHTLSETELFPEGESSDIKTFRVVYKDGCFMPAIRSMVLLKALGGCARVLSTIPDDLDGDSAGDEILHSGLYIKLLTDDAGKALDTLKNGIDVVSAEEVKRPGRDDEDGVAERSDSGSRSSLPGEPPAVHTDKMGAQSSIISVRLEKLDRLLELVSEIVIAESAVTSSPDLKKSGVRLDRFKKSSRELKKLTDELQDVVMSIRMVPVSSVFSKMSRIVRDMNKKLGKNAELVFQGADTEVDKSVIDILGDPLMHIVRNALDHGIETDSQRKEQGKTEPARVVLSAGYESSEVVIKCSDNGSGMDPKRLLAKAKRNGLLTKPESEYTESECFDFIMKAGFSTNEEVTEFSGRGVGMDVVRRNIEKVGGKLSVSSEPGAGSEFVIRIPLSLSIIDVLGVVAGGEGFAVPISSVGEVFRARPEQLVTDPGGTELVMFREKCLRVLRLSEVFGLGSAKQELTQGIMLYCAEEGREAVLFADELTSDQQVVVKPFSPLLSRFNLKEKGLIGCSVLADGSILFIAGVNEIFKAHGITPSGDNGSEEVYADE
ncbi:chemotaxis protein CheA [Ruminococcus sp. Marseille-P6503]|uniref:chemotaxis protein CheA n=1 Tax=Ruminococcus sp. Marseille-P6503 TaxID=2364796 RepID=UPI000F52BB9B|nr:chemotaxis protein CheA [Ruminococcus sp. Marseille-P6503]